MPPPATAETMAAFLAPIADRAVETCVLIYLDPLGRIVGTRHVSGRAGTVEVTVRTIVIDALAFAARSVLAAHNHPSGDATASRDDLVFTRRLAQGLAAIDVDLADHLILARGGGSLSLRAKGYL